MGDTTLGQRILLPGDPTTAMHAATKQYADTKGVYVGTDPAAAPNNSLFYDTDAPSYLWEMSGSGSPEGVVTASPGAVWRQTDHATWGYLKWVKNTGTGSTGWLPDFEGRPPYIHTNVVSHTGNGWLSPTFTSASARGCSIPSMSRFDVPFPGIYEFTAWARTMTNTQTRLLMAVRADNIDPASDGNYWISDNPSNGHSTVKVDSAKKILLVDSFVRFAHYTDVVGQVVYFQVSLVWIGNKV